MNISTEEAVEVIKEWGVDCDNFVAHNYSHRMVSGGPTDNSIELGEYFLKCLKIVTDLGLQSQAQPQDSADDKNCPKCGNKLSLYNFCWDCNHQVIHR